MPDVLGEPPSPRVALFWNGTAWQWALVDAAGHLQLDVLTAAGLQNALQSVATDRLIVRGEDQLFSFNVAVRKRTSGNIAGADGFWDSNPVPAGNIWIITAVVAEDTNNPTTEHRYFIRVGGVDIEFANHLKAFATNERSDWSGHIFISATGFIRVYFIGALANDWCGVSIHGYQMTVES